MARMSRRSPSNLLTLTQLAAIALASAISSGCACPAVGYCAGTAEFSASLPLDTLEIGDSISIQTCHNAICGEANVTLVCTASGCGGSCDLERVNVACFVYQDADAWRIGLAYNVSYDSDYAADGDLYYVKVIRTATGEVLVTTLDIVTYEDTSSDEGCDDEPCLVVTRGPFALG